MELKYRHEYKFALSVSDYFIVRSRLLAALRHDPHAGTTGEYGIRSVYFDNLEDKALREKLDGVNNREKFRIRYYNGELSYLTLEKKSKRDGLCSKKGDSITAQEADRLFHGDTGWMKVSGRPVAAELYGKMKTQQLRPKTVVDYLREPLCVPSWERADHAGPGASHGAVSARSAGKAPCHASSGKRRPAGGEIR